MADEYIKNVRKKVGTMPLVVSVTGCVIVDEQQRVLLQHRTDNETWSIPGGAIEPGESVEEAVTREVYEETNLQVRELELFDIYSGESQHYIYPNGDECYFVNVIYISGEFSGELKSDQVESKEVRFWDLTELPRLSPSNKVILHEFAEYGQG